MTEKRYITAVEWNTTKILELLRDIDTNMPAKEVYYRVMRKLDEEDINYQDNYASHHSELPRQNGYVSFYFIGGQWNYVKH